MTRVTDLRDLVAPEIVEALDRHIEERVREVIAECDTNTSPQWLSIEEASTHLRVSPRTLHRLLRSQRIRAESVGRRRVIARTELDRYMNATEREDVAPTTSPLRRTE